MTKKVNNLVPQWAIVTGASKGLGFAYCELLLQQGYHIIAVARETAPLQQLTEKYPLLTIICYNYDLSKLDNCYLLYEQTRNKNITLLINNAGYGVWGYFATSDLTQELNMLDLNIKALHILTKLFTQRFCEQQVGRILNIGSMASFAPGPVFASYFASKSYVLSLGIAINTELKKTKQNVRVITLCPGTLKTDFWNRSSNQKNAKYYSKAKVMNTIVYARKSLKQGLKAKYKNYIITGKKNKFVHRLSKWMPESWTLNWIYNYQRNRK